MERSHQFWRTPRCPLRQMEPSCGRAGTILDFYYSIKPKSLNLRVALRILIFINIFVC